MFPDGAGVHDYHIGTLGFGCDGVATLLQHTPDPLGVSFILLAAVSFYIGGGSGVPFTPVSGDLITKGELEIQRILRNNSCLSVHKKSSS
jgi:hypothetical protein